MIKKLLCSVLCVVLLFCGGVRAYAVEACENDNHTYKVYRHDFGGYLNYNYSYHTKVWFNVEICTKCGYESKKRELDMEMHSTHDRYDDLGHMDGSHMYRLYCACGYNESRTIPCNVVNCVHNTPW